MSIADEVRAAQDEKEMTRNAIKMLLAINPGDSEGIALAAEFREAYGENV